MVSSKSPRFPKGMLPMNTPRESLGLPMTSSSTPGPRGQSRGGTASVPRGHNTNHVAPPSRDHVSRQQHRSTGVFPVTKGHLRTTTPPYLSPTQLSPRHAPPDRQGDSRWRVNQFKKALRSRLAQRSAQTRNMYYSSDTLSDADKGSETASSQVRHRKSSQSLRTSTGKHPQLKASMSSSFQTLRSQTLRKQAKPQQEKRDINGLLYTPRTPRTSEPKQHSDMWRSQKTPNMTSGKTKSCHYPSPQMLANLGLFKPNANQRPTTKHANQRPSTQQQPAAPAPRRPITRYNAPRLVTDINTDDIPTEHILSDEATDRRQQPPRQKEVDHKLSSSSDADRRPSTQQADRRLFTQQATHRRPSTEGAQQQRHPAKADRPSTGSDELLIQINHRDKILLTKSTTGVSRLQLADGKSGSMWTLPSLSGTAPFNGKSLYKYKYPLLL